jgi:hypothetical protein
VRCAPALPKRRRRASPSAAALQVKSRGNTGGSLFRWLAVVVAGGTCHTIWMISRAITVLFLICTGSLAAETLEFNRDIRPILSDRCFKCHGPDAKTQEAGLRLDTEAGALALIHDSETRYVIVPGKPDQSELVFRIFADDPDEIMPPVKSELRLSAEEKDLLKRWIEQGAEFQKHWSFIPVTRVEPPSVSNPGWCRNPIDNFILSRLDHEGMQPSERADRLTLLKRVGFDLTGLPPTPEEIDAFLADRSGNAYEKAVDRLLASDAYGERMALIWVDAARYADTSGYQADWERFMWPWREWAIGAYNRNMPFDQFTIEQLAGDLLEKPTQAQLIATAFNRNHRINDEEGVIAEEFLVEYVVDRVETVSTVWMGLTMGCARCHDHKYDPLSQQDFYRMFSFFNNVPENGKDGRKGYAKPFVDFPVADQQAAFLEAEKVLKAMEAKPKTGDPDVRKAWASDLRFSLQSGQKPAWEMADVIRAEASAGLTFKSLDDGSLLVQPPVAIHPAYDVTITLPAGKLTAIRLDVLADESLNGQGLAPSENGNFVLTEFELLLNDVATAELSPVPLRQAQADYEQKRRPVAHAIDGKPKTGWAVLGGGDNEDRAAVFVLETPVDNVADHQWVVRMKHDTDYPGHYIGRFKLSATGDPAPSLDGQNATLPEAVKQGILAETPTSEQAKTLDDYFFENHPSMAEARKALDAKRKAVVDLKSKAFVQVMVMNEMETPRETYVLNRGLYDQPDKSRRVSAQVPGALGRIDGKAATNRMALATWLVNGSHPLTGRVTVNRYWQMYFGRGLVETTEDFGAQGSLPSHPELLDWLASEFVRTDWDVKAMQKLIVMSATYQQSSKMTPETWEQDPVNILLARGPRFRLSGYQIRDQALAASGLLIDRIGGPSVKPYQPPGLWAEVSFQDKKRSTDFFVQDEGEKLYRRSLYTFWKRSVAPPQMATFDAAGREACAVRLVRTSTPLQALTLLNDTTFLEASRHMAARMMAQGPSPEERIGYGLKLASIAADTSLLRILTKGLADYRASFEEDVTKAAAILRVGESPQHDQLDPVEHAAYTIVASVILNLDQTITKE